MLVVVILGPKCIIVLHRIINKLLGTVKNVLPVVLQCRGHKLLLTFLGLLSSFRLALYGLTGSASASPLLYTLSLSFSFCCSVFPSHVLTLKCMLLQTVVSL